MPSVRFLLSSYHKHFLQTCKGGLERLLPLAIYSSANLTYSEGEVFLYNYLLPGLRRGDPILLDSFLTTVKYDGMFNKTLIPVEHENIEAKFGSIRRFRYSNRNGNNDFESIKDTNMFIMEHGVRTKTFPLEILNDNLYEKESIVNLAIKKTVGFCVLMPCQYVQSLYCRANGGSLELSFDNQWTGAIEYNANISTLLGLIEKFIGVETVYGYNDDVEDRICSPQAIITTVITFNMKDSAQLPPKAMYVNSSLLHGASIAYVLVNSPEPSDPNRGEVPESLEPTMQISVLNDYDSGGQFGFRNSIVHISEIDRTAFIEIIRTNGSGGDAYVTALCHDITAKGRGTDMDTRLVDYDCPESTIHFVDGQQNYPFPVNIFNDTIHEGNLSFLISLVNVQGEMPPFRQHNRLQLLLLVMRTLVRVILVLQRLTIMSRMTKTLCLSR